MTLNKVLVAAAFLVLTACGEAPQPASPGSSGAPAIIAAGHHLISYSCTVDPTLSTAPANENALQRWQRTKADYDRIGDEMQKCRDQLSSLDDPDLSAFEAYEAAQKALENAKCSSICVPLTGQRR